MEIFKQSLCQATLARMILSCAPCGAQAIESKICTCLRCLLQRLVSLPDEILAMIASLHFQTPLRHVMSIFGETYRLFAELEQRPAPATDLSVCDEIFERRFVFGMTEYVTGLYNKMVPGSRIIKRPASPSQHLTVHMGRLGITKIHFPSAIPVNPKALGEWVYSIQHPMIKLYVQYKVSDWSSMSSR